MFGMHPKGTQFVKLTQNHNLDFQNWLILGGKLNERQGKNRWLCSKMSVDLGILIFLDYFSYSLRKVSMKSMRRYMYISPHREPTTKL